VFCRHIYFGVKGQGHNICVGLQTEQHCSTCWPRWIFPAVMPPAQATLVFPCVTSTRMLAAGRRFFPAWVFALLWVLASSRSYNVLLSCFPVTSVESQSIISNSVRANTVVHGVWKGVQHPTISYPHVQTVCPGISCCVKTGAVLLQPWSERKSIDRCYQTGTGYDTVDKRTLKSWQAGQLNLAHSPKTKNKQKMKSKTE